VRFEFLAAWSPNSTISAVSASPPTVPVIPAVLLIPFKPLVAYSCLIALTVELPNIPAFVMVSLPVEIPIEVRTSVAPIKSTLLADCALCISVVWTLLVLSSNYGVIWVPGS
jgi:hypothetical protein